MTGPAGALGPMLEMMTWVGFVPGIPLLIAGWIVARRRCQWTTTTAEVFEAGGFQGFRWSDSENTPRLALHDPAEVQILDVGTQVELHYDKCHPARWGLGPPPRDNHALLIGWILTGTGILCTVAGFMLMMF
ncbi:hypothetical protein OIU93_00345 [Paeniglutamicibacter sp. ZC-3]|uniref:hypothetical protein n=1 Tax=Paeniglutamicibacter TaxID=1742990 RepID=UPI0021F7348C|nr:MULTISPECIES: hypothetical protein [Paeniglutamicibacter]MCV9992744.1 hypothetical protein [Paeniglutamicibacter sp. ZC-3]MDO2933029.1 hypothetical protein [Paeniglutamicibacter sulfureus]